MTFVIGDEIDKSTNDEWVITKLVIGGKVEKLANDE